MGRAEEGRRRDLGLRLQHPLRPREGEARKESAFLHDARHASETDDESTFNAFGSWITLFVGTIDFVFYRQAEVLRFDTIRDDYGVPWVSDHYSVIADVKY